LVQDFRLDQAKLQLRRDGFWTRASPLDPTQRSSGIAFPLAEPGQVRGRRTIINLNP
jgi:hypothetical protein